MADDQYLLPEFKPRWFKRMSLDRWFSIGAFIVSALAVYEAHRQASITEKIRKDAKDAFNAQAKDVERSRIAAENSASAAKTVVETMRRALVLSERPLLQTVNAKLLQPVVVGGKVVMQTQTANVGKGPAYDIRIQEGVRISSAWDFPFRNLPVERAGVLGLSAIVSNPTIDTQTSKDGTLTNIEFNNVQAGRARLYIYGLVVYEQRTLETPETQHYSYCYYVSSLEKGSAVFASCPVYPPVPH